MENQTFSFRVFLLGCAVLAGLIGAASLVGEDKAPNGILPRPPLAASQAPAPAALPPPAASAPRGGDAVDGELDPPPAGSELDEPRDGSGS